ncbi:transcriptional regulator [Burkholderiales bacterium JOSHI_001]|nr:transcriptional regulator [Burkholderiales bacterium JOSHI_001]
MNNPRHRPLSLDFLRAFEAVARRLSFSAAAQELHLTQSAVSRQIKSLEDDLGTPLFHRGTRRVELTGAGQTLQAGVLPLLTKLDRTVRDIRQRGARKQVSLSTFASFATLWLMPQVAEFQKTHPDIDIRISASDRLIDQDDPELDLLLRYGLPGIAPAGAQPLFSEVLSPVASPRLLEQAQAGQAPPLAQVADLARHTLLEEDDPRATAQYLSWQRWLTEQGQPDLAPQRWVYLNYTHQQVQGALAGQGVALARLALVHELLERGELVEPFGPARRLHSPAGYWLIRTRRDGPERPEVQALADWIAQRAAATRRAMGGNDTSTADGHLGESD